MTGGWRLAARNLRRNRRRNLATGLAVAIGFAGLALLGGYVTHVDGFLRTNAVFLQHSGHVVVYHREGLDKGVARPARFGLTAGDQLVVRKAAAADSRVSFSAGYLKGMGLAGNGCRSVPFLGLGIDLEAQRRILTSREVAAYSPDLARPVRGAQLFEREAVEDGVGLATGLAALLGKTEVHDQVRVLPPAAMPDCSRPDALAELSADPNLQLAGVAVDGSLAAVDGTVTNIFHTPSAQTEDQVLQASLTTLQRLYDTDAVTYVAIFLHDWRDADGVAADLRRSLAAAGLQAAVYPFTDERVNPYYAGSMAFIRSMAGFILIIVAAVVVLGIMNSTTLTVYERSRELGTLRAVGYTRSQVSGLVVREVALLAGLGVLGGLAVAHLAAGAVRWSDVRINPPGVPGTMQVVLTPGAGLSLALAALLVLLSLAVAWAVARRRLRERTSDLLIAVSA